MVVDNMPVGNYQWNAVAIKYNTEAAKNGYTYRNADALKIKFDKLAATKNPTDDLSCSPCVRRAKTLLSKRLASQMLETLEVPKKRKKIMVMNMISVLLE